MEVFELIEPLSQYGKHKEREDFPGTFISQDSSPIGGQPILRKSQSTPFSLRKIGRHNHSSTNLRGAAPETTSRRNSGIFDSSFFSPSSFTANHNAQASIPPAGAPTGTIPVPTSATTRSSTRTDTITYVNCLKDNIIDEQTRNIRMTLAQRLNELAAANDEGLLK